jgi:hypothetical protein
MNAKDDPGHGPVQGSAAADGEEGFLARWSRRKRELGQQPAAPAPGVEAAASPPVPPEDDKRPRDPETGELIDEEWLRTLPDASSLGPGADLSPFMRRGVPEALRRQALRSVWMADPAIRDYVSPALDYAYDYNTPGGAPGYGPLSESDIEQARAFLDDVFSKPASAQDSDGADAADSVEAAIPGHSEALGPNRGNESQGGAGEPSQALRLTDAAVQHGSPGGSRGDLPEPSGTGPEIRENTAPAALHPGSAAMQRSMVGPEEKGQITEKPGAIGLTRRRGGGATPV